MIDTCQHILLWIEAIMLDKRKKLAGKDLIDNSPLEALKDTPEDVSKSVKGNSSGSNSKVCVCGHEKAWHYPTGELTRRWCKHRGSTEAYDCKCKKFEQAKTSKGCGVLYESEPNDLDKEVYLLTCGLHGICKSCQEEK